MGGSVSRKTELRDRLRTLYERDPSFKESVRTIVEQEDDFQEARREKVHKACVSGACKRSAGVPTKVTHYDGRRDAIFQLTDLGEVHLTSDAVSHKVQAERCGGDADDSLCFADGTHAVDGNTLKAGTAPLVPHYRLQLGDGGEWLVHKAIHADSKATCAQKLCHATRKPVARDGRR